MRPLIIAALLCTWSACSCDPAPCTNAGGSGFGGAGGGPEPQQIGYAGKPINVEIEVVETFRGCADPANERVTGAVVEVLDPSNQRVAATVTTPVQANGEVTCTVTFTPATAGPYHVAVRLTPNGGTVQRDVLAAVDRRDTTANIFPLGSDRPVCDQIDFDGQTLLCHDVMPSPQLLRTMRLSGGQGVTISAVPANAFALTEGRVWVYDPNQGVVVYGLGSDGTLAFRGASGITTQGTAPKLLAQNDQALFVDSLGFQQLSFLPDGGFSSGGVTSFPSNTAGQWLPGMGATMFNGFGNLCSWNLQGAAPADADAGSCTPLETTSVMGYDSDGVWWIDRKAMVMLSGQTLFVTGWHAGRDHPTQGTINFLSGSQPQPPFTFPAESSVVLAVTNANGTTVDTLLPRFDGSLTWFEHWPTFNTFATVNADSRYLWYQDTAANTLTYYRR